MNLEIITKELRLDLYGFSEIASTKNYSETAFKLMNKMWQVVKSNNLKTKGLNIWVYEPNDKVFAGVELDSLTRQDTGLEHKSVVLEKYAYYKHVGSYNLIKQVGQSMKDALTKRDLENRSPYVEIYGHWNNDETKLETELLMCLK
jgi:predicted transcriptional regulator YdeE